MSKKVVTLAVLLLIAVLVSTFAQEEDALVAFRQGRYADAIRITAVEIQRSPGNMDSYAVQGWSLLSLSRWADAVDLAQRGLQVSRYDHRLIAIMGEAQYQLGNNIAALQYLEEYTSIRPQGAVIEQIYQLMAEVHIRLEEYHRADIAYSAAVYYEPGNAEWWSRLGFSREQTGNISAALAAYEKALEINPNIQSARQAITRIQG